MPAETAPLRSIDFRSLVRPTLDPVLKSYQDSRTGLVLDIRVRGLLGTEEYLVMNRADALEKEWAATPPVTADLKKVVVSHPLCYNCALLEEAQVPGEGEKHYPADELALMATTMPALFARLLRDVHELGKADVKEAPKTETDGSAGAAP